MIETMGIGQLNRVATGIQGAEEKDDFIVSASAIEMIAQIKEANEISEDYFLRLGTRSGGCSGMNYTLGFDSEIQENDRTFEVENVNIVVDNKSLFYLMGVTLDYTDGPSGSGFVFNNPNNAHVCGCGAK
jgi:iron-sulfur cluster assembly protein